MTHARARPYTQAVAAGGATGEAKDAKPVLEELGMQFHAAVKAVPTR